MATTHEALDALLADACARGVCSGAVALVRRGGRVRYHAAFGTRAQHPSVRDRDEPIGLDAIFDLASLTKVLATTTLAAQAVSAGAVELRSPLPEQWRGPWTRAGVEAPTLADLLEHASGLAAHREFFTTLPSGAPAAFVDAALDLPLDARPRERAIYSDLGFWLLGAWLDALGEGPWQERFEQEVASALGLARGELGYLPEPSLRVVPTEVYDRALHAEAPSYFAVRQRPFAEGEVHDDNAYVMGGVAPHAGLFGTAEAVAAVADAWLRRDVPGVAPEVVDAFVEASSVAGSTRRRGFDGVDPGGGSTGGALGPRAFGHLGYTGTSAWIDPESDAVYVLLTNRVHPSRDDDRIRELRPAFHRLAANV